MPIYEYQCEACQHTFTEIVRSPEDRPVSPPCPECSATETHRVISAPSVVTTERESEDGSEQADRQQAQQANRQDLNQALRKV